jgi:hypothetical protein
VHRSPLASRRSNRPFREPLRGLRMTMRSQLCRAQGQHEPQTAALCRARCRLLHDALYLAHAAQRRQGTDLTRAQLQGIGELLPALLRHLQLPLVLPESVHAWAPVSQLHFQRALAVVVVHEMAHALAGASHRPVGLMSTSLARVGLLNPRLALDADIGPAFLAAVARLEAETSNRSLADGSVAEAASPTR